MKAKTEKKSKKTKPTRQRYPLPEHTWEEINKMTTDYVVEFPPAILNLPEEAKQDPLALNQRLAEAAMIIARTAKPYKDEKTRQEGRIIGGKVETRLPGIIAAIKEFKEKPVKTSKGDFIQFLSKKEYTHKTPYQIDQYDLYVDDGLIYHRDRLKKDKKGKINLRWDRPITISSLDRYYYEYVK